MLERSLGWKSIRPQAQDLVQLLAAGKAVKLPLVPPGVFSVQVHKLPFRYLYVPQLIFPSNYVPSTIALVQLLASPVC